MTDSIIKNIYDKHLKNWFKKNYKFLLTILIYILFQSNFLFSILYSLGINLSILPNICKRILLYLNDTIYVVIIILMYKKEIKEGIYDLKKNFSNRASLSVKCWIFGCVLMVVSSIIINHFLNQNASINEQIIRNNIKKAPIYMIFTCSFVAPILEEMTFRRSLYGLIKNKWIFIISSGVIFGLLHVIGSYNNIFDFLYIIPYGAMGSCFAFLLTKTNNITLPIIIHVLHNTILVMNQIFRG